jgi:hypothetical protein
MESLTSTRRASRASDQDRDDAAELLIEAYAVGRLSREELDERATAAYSAKTRGELHDATAGLSLPGARAGLPSDSVGVPRRAGGRLIGHMILTFFVLVLAAYLAGLVAVDAVFEAMVPVPTALVLLLQPPLGTSEQCSTRDPRGRPMMPAEVPQPGPRREAEVGEAGEAAR